MCNNNNVYNRNQGRVRQCERFCAVLLVPNCCFMSFYIFGFFLMAGGDNNFLPTRLKISRDRWINKQA
jgi:hypothetical protein